MAGGEENVANFVLLTRYPSIKLDAIKYAQGKNVVLEFLKVAEGNSRADWDLARDKRVYCT